MKRTLTLALVFLSLFVLGSCDFILETLYPEATLGGGGGNNSSLVVEIEARVISTNVTLSESVNNVMPGTNVSFECIEVLRESRITNYTWRVANQSGLQVDGVIDAAPGYTFIFSDPGTYTITLTVVDFDGNTDSATFTVVVAF